MAVIKSVQRPGATPAASGSARVPWRATLRRVAPGYIVLATMVALHLLLFLGIFPYTNEDTQLHGFVSLSFHDSGRTLDGAVPYRNFLLEYPPGTLLFMLLPHLLSAGYRDYRSLFFAEVAILDLLVLGTLYASARIGGLAVARVLGLYTLALVLLGPLVSYRLDLAPAALTALAVLAWQRNRPTLAAVLLAMGAATKVYPLLLLPPLIVDQWIRGRRRAVVAALAFCVALTVCLSPMLLALLGGPQGLLASLRFQTNRHLQVESIWATPPLLLFLFDSFPLLIAGRERALVILGPGDAFGQAGTPALIVIVLVIYALWWRLRARPDLRMPALLIGTAALTLAAAIMDKVLSPQYLIWAIPAFALLPLSWPGGGSTFPRRALLAPALFTAALPVTQWIYPLHYGALIHLVTPLAVAMLALRNLLLVLALLVLLSTFWRLRQLPVASSQ